MGTVKLVTCNSHKFGGGSANQSPSWMAEPFLNFGVILSSIGLFLDCVSCVILYSDSAYCTIGGLSPTWLAVEVSAYTCFSYSWCQPFSERNVCYRLWSMTAGVSCADSTSCEFEIRSNQFETWLMWCCWQAASWCGAAPAGKCSFWGCQWCPRACADGLTIYSS